MKQFGLILRLLTVLVATAVSAVAQGQPSQEQASQGQLETTPLKGIWQFQGTRNQPDAEFRRSSATILKILSGDGVITNLVVTPKGSAITARGTYAVESDSVYTEHILETPGNKAIDGKKVRLFYQIKENKQLYLRFFLEKNLLGTDIPATYEELWIRVGVPKMPGDFNSPIEAAGADTGEYRLVWADEFNQAGAVSAANWQFEKGFVRNREDQWYQEDNAFCEDGLLIIEARKEKKSNPSYREGSDHWGRSRPTIEYTSASINTRGKHSWQYGRFEMRARIPVGQGFWPAFWTLGVKGDWPSNGEIDIMEYYRDMLLANIACGTDEPWKAKWYTTETPLDSLGGRDWADQFHVWRMDWTEQEIALYVDDLLLNRVPLSKLVNRDDSGINPFRQPHYILLNFALGGMNGGRIDDSLLPARYAIDYVRVYQKGTASGAASTANRVPAVKKDVPLESIRLSDPFILADKKTATYYMTGTGGMLWKSKDLKKWTGPFRVIRHDPKSWMGPHPMVWAAELHEYKGKYYNFATFTNRAVTIDTVRGNVIERRASHVLVSDRPDGPYVPMADSIYLPADQPTLDGTFWVDRDGKPYMIFCHEWLQNWDGTMEKIELKPDLSGTTGKRQILFRASDSPWSRERREDGTIVPNKVTDGPFLFRTQTGKLGMLWSSWVFNAYTQGVAYSESGTLDGPWVQQKEPVTPPNYGHGMLFRTFEGKLLMVAHSHRKDGNGPTIRIPHLFEVDDSGDRIKVGDPL